MNKRQKNKQRKQFYKGSAVDPRPYTRFHKYPNLTIQIDRRKPALLIQVGLNCTMDPLPISYLQEYIGCWNDSQKMMQATRHIHEQTAESWGLVCSWN